MTKSPITFVNFCVDIGRGDIPMVSHGHASTIRRDFDLYKMGMMENISTHVPLVVYSSVKDIILPGHRNDTNLRYNYFDKMTLESEFPNFELFRETYPKTHKDEIATLLFYYAPLVVLKLKKIVDVINENPFNSDLFFWMDCHFTRGVYPIDHLMIEENYLNMYENVSKKLGDKFLLFNHTNRPFGFFWGGTRTAIMNVYQRYFEIFFEFLPKTILTEELIFKKIYEENPDIFSFNDLTSVGQNYKLAVTDYLTT